MSEYRIKGEVGPDNITVRTEWIADTRPEARGVMAGFEIRGWENVEIEERAAHE